MRHNYNEALKVFNKAIEEGCKCSIWNNVLHCLREDGSMYEDDEYDWDVFVSNYEQLHKEDYDEGEFVGSEIIYVGEDGTRISGFSYEKDYDNEEKGFFEVDGRYDYYGDDDNKEFIQCEICHHVYLGEDYDECPVCKWQYVGYGKQLFNKKKVKRLSPLVVKENLLKGIDALGNPLSWEQKYKYVLNNICKVDISVIASKFQNLNRDVVAEYKDVLRKNPDAPSHAFARIKLDDKCLNDEGYERFIKFMCEYMNLTEEKLIEWSYRLAKYR